MSRRSGSRGGGKPAARPSERPGKAADGAAGRGSGGGRRAKQLAEGLLLLGVVVVPVLFLPTVREAFDLPKLLAGEWLALASLVALAAGAALGRGPVFRLRGGGWPGRARSLPALRAVLPLVAAALVSWALSTHRAYATQGLIHLVIGAAALVGWSLALESVRLRRVLLAMLVPATLVALLAALQLHDVYRIFAFADSVETERQGITSLAGNPGHLAGFLALVLVIGIAWLRLGVSGRGSGDGPAPRGARRALVVSALAVVLYGLAATQTLAALAAVGAGVVTLAVLVLPPRRTALLLGASLLAAVLLVAVLAPLRGRVVEKGRELAAGEVNALLTGRLDGWRAAGWMVARHPLAGVGPGAFVTEFNAAKLDLLDRGVPFFRLHAEPTFSSAHNEVLQVGAELGVPGLLALAWGLWVVGGAVRRIVRRGVVGEPTLAAGGLAVLAVLALLHFPFRIAITGFPALLWLAWVLRRAWELEATTDAAGTEAPGSGVVPAEDRTGGGRRLAAWAVLALTVAALAGHTLWARDLLRASRVVNTVERATMVLAARGPVPGALLWAHVRMLKDAQGLNPAAVAAVAAEGAQFILLERPEDAAGAYGRGLAMEPRPELYLNRGRALWSAGRRDAAVDDFERAARLHPGLRRQMPPAAWARVRARLEGAGL